MKYYADLHFHSHYSRACSQDLTIANNALWAKRKGIHIIGTNDFTHPLWLSELKQELVEVGPGIYKYKKMTGENDPFFICTVETSHIFTALGKGRRVHVLVWAPSLEVVDKINAGLVKAGANLLSDGRPIMGLSLRELAQIVLEADEKCLIIPAHAWTPWYGIFGDKSGFDSLAEAFAGFADQIYAIETGLSSDPAMNWAIPELKDRAIVSFSDAHSPQKIGREVTIFELEDLERDGYLALHQAVKGTVPLSAGKNCIASTIEFYPQEGKYHYNGHRKCKVRLSPSETRQQGRTCPVCGRQITVGVMQRVEELSGGWDLDLKVRVQKLQAGAVSLVQDPLDKRPPYIMLLPLMEIIAEARGVGVNTKTVRSTYDQLIGEFGSEFYVLLKAQASQVAAVAGERIAQGIARVRAGQLTIEPGFDGEFGQVKIWNRQTANSAVSKDSKQELLF